MPNPAVFPFLGIGPSFAGATNQNGVTKGQGTELTQYWSDNANDCVIPFDMTPPTLNPNPQVCGWGNNTHLTISGVLGPRPWDLISNQFNGQTPYVQTSIDRNPIKLVRQSAKRRAAPKVLIPDEIKLLLDNLELRERTLVLVAASTGLRQSELFALKWGDIDFSQGAMNVTRSIAYGIVGRCKTEASQKTVSVHPILVAALVDWRESVQVSRTG